MAAQVGNLQVRVGADITGLKTGMVQAQRTVASSAGAMRTEVKALQLTFADMATASSRAWRVFLGGAAILGTARAVIGVTDAFKSLQAQLRLATSQFGSFEQANKDVQGIASRTRSDLQSTAELYAALQRNADQFGGTQAQVARITETVAKSFKISGASADEAANATRQLVQAFQSGRLQGDEFRSMMENAPRLARLLADSLGITVGKLRQMSKEGKLTADVLARAFSDQRFTGTIDAEFKQLPVTFDQAMNQLYNAAVITFGEFDQGGQFSTALANFITSGSEGFDELSNKAYRFGADVRGIFDALDSVKDAFGSVHTTGLQGLLGLDDATVTLVGTIGTLLDVLDATIAKFADLARAPYILYQAITGGPFATGNVTNFGGNFRADVNARRVDAARRQIMGRNAADVLGEFGLGKKPPPFHPTDDGKKKKGPKDRSADVEAQFAAELRQADMDILRAKQDLTQNAEERAKIELQLLELERQNENASVDDKVRRAKQDLAGKRITATAYKKIVADAEILKQKNDEAARLKAQAVIDERRRQVEEDTFKLAEQDRQFKIDALQSADQLATTAAEHRRIQLQILDAEIEQKRLELEHEKQLAIRNGATQQEIDAIQARIDNLQNERSQGAAAIMQGTRGPLEEYFSQVPKNIDEAREAMERLKVQGIDGAIDALLELRHGFGAFRDAAIRALDDVIAQLLRMQLMKLAFSFLGGGSPASLGADAFSDPFGGGSFLPPGFATGGSFSILGNPGIDKNTLSLNGLPIARVSHGERLNIGNDNTPAGEGRGRMGGSVTIHAPITINGNADRATMDQAANSIRRKVARVVEKGY